MKTTLDIDDALLRQAERYASEHNQRLESVIEEALRLALEMEPEPTSAKPIQLPAFGSGGLLPGVSLDSTSVLLERMEGRE